MQRFVAMAACMTLAAMGAKAAPLPQAGTFRESTAASGVPVSAAVWAQSQGETELLGVRINEVAQEGEVLAVRVSAHKLAVPVEALQNWRLRLPSTTLLRIDGRDHVVLDAIPGLHWRVDDASQTLIIEVPSAAFLRNGFEVVSETRPAQSIAGIGGYVNYDLSWQRDSLARGAGTSDVSGGLFDVGAFNAFGNGRSSGVWRSSGGVSQFTRLDTTWNIDMPANMSSVHIGDAIGVAGGWGRSVRFGGVQWTTNFAVQPGLVRFPMPAIRGEANVPSIVDLYVNSTHQLQGKVPAGGFDLPDVPVITGAGEIKMVVRDLLGREQVIVQPYYVSPSLLREGLHDFSIEAGRVREDYGLASADYGRAMFTATDRAGVTDEFTREYRAEVLRGQQAIGATGIWLVKQAAVINLSVAASRSDTTGTGYQGLAGIDHQASGWSAGIQSRYSTRDFAQLGQSVASFGSSVAQTPRASVSANFGSTIGNGGLSLNVIQQSTWEGDSFRSLSASYGRSVGPLGYVSVFASRTLGSSSGTSIGISLIQSLGDNTSASLSSYRSRDRSIDPTQAPQNSQQTTLQVQGNPPSGPGFGYQLMSEQGSFSRNSADLRWQTERVAMSAGVANASGTDSFRAGASGGFALMPEGVFASRRIDGSFAVVQVGDYEGIRVNRDNQFVGVTDSKGRAFVGGLRGYESNRISVDPSDLPLDAQVDDLHVLVAPGMGSGVSVRFPVKRTRAVTLRLVQADGEPVPPGSWVRIDSQTREYPVGFDGRLFLAGLAEHSTIRAEWNGQSCNAEITSTGVDDVPELGTTPCR